MTKRVAFVAAAMIVGHCMIDASAKDSHQQTKSETATSQRVAQEVDRRIADELQRAKISVADRCNDVDFLRRISLDIVGLLPTPAQVLAFRDDPDPGKRAKRVNQLIDSPEFGMNWARYWRDVIYLRATEQRSRLNQDEFETWMAAQWNSGQGWNSTVTDMLTATGDVEEHPETALIFAQGANPEEVAAEACRVFLGIQLQCANCHDHPSDIWKRSQFHELAAYFPRISERRAPGSDKMRTFEIVSVNTERKQGEFMREHPEQFLALLDRNKDHKLSKEEMNVRPGKKAKSSTMEMKDLKDVPLNPKMIDRLFEVGDVDKDGFLTLAEIQALPQPPDKSKRGSLEHHMVDLQNPASPGKVINPKFFVDGSSLSHGQSDEVRRHAVAKAFTSPENPWFARAVVNRIWAEMLGEGFYMPIDDLGPSRAPRYPEVLDLICQGFVANRDDPKWLIRTIASTDAYQRKIQVRPASETHLPFAFATPVPLRSDVIFSSLTQVFGLTDAEMGGRGGRMKNAKDTMEMTEKRPYQQSPRFLFNALFGVDPSVPKEDVSENIPQSLLMMNSRAFRGGMSAQGNTQLAKILREHKDHREALNALYLLVLAREPFPQEIDICLQHIADVKQRPESFEDLMWSLLNSSEFISRR